MRIDNFQFDAKRLAELCEKHHVVRLELFGSCVGGDATPNSDVDALVTVEPGAQIGLDIVALQQAITTLFGRSVDLLERACQAHGVPFAGVPRIRRSLVIGDIADISKAAGTASGSLRREWL